LDKVNILSNPPPSVYNAIFQNSHEFRCFIALIAVGVALEITAIQVLFVIIGFINFVWL